ncbi:hypothetical protein Gogos_020277 [Gossypium gossypioides]|uniref:Uncharacterized protein n=1 Tax=Gossypium gossypioides TaxID=34282 RepID=A0A7J9D2X8_GOSGO|nr:hypothetical protein [Gossypium gossypioides]
MRNIEVENYKKFSRNLQL